VKAAATASARQSDCTGGAYPTQAKARPCLHSRASFAPLQQRDRDAVLPQEIGRRRARDAAPDHHHGGRRSSPHPAATHMPPALLGRGRQIPISPKLQSRYTIQSSQPTTSASFIFPMSDTLLKALIALVPACLLFAWSVMTFAKSKSVWSLLQLVGAGSLVVVILTHICEALHLFPFMDWGSPQSVGHYLDLFSAILGLTLFPTGFLIQRFSRRRTSSLER